MTLTTTSLKQNLTVTLRRIRRYILPIFLVFIIAIYGFLTWRVITFNQVQPDQAKVAAQLKTAGVPRIDPDALQKIQQLQDNSVDVQTLFDQARSSPFQE